MSSKPDPPPSTPPSPAERSESLAAKKPIQVKGRKRRMARWCVRVVIGVPLILIAVSLIIANSPIVGSMVRREIEAATGCVVEMDRARIDLDGRVEIKNLRLLIPGLSGPEAELLSAQKAEIDLSWAAGLSWAGMSAVKPTSIRLTNPVFRLSQSVDDGSLNLAGLARAGGGGAPSSIPTVNVQDGRVEFAEHSAKRSWFEVLNTIHVAGAFSSRADGSYRIRMQEIGRLPPPRLEGEPQIPRGMILDGQIDLQQAEATLRLLNVPLEAWPPESVPLAFRETWRRLRIQGQIRETTFTYDREGGVRLSVWPEDVAMDIPVPRESDSAADDLSLSGVKGKFTFSKDGLSAELEGVLEEQTKPVHVTFQTQGTELDAPLVCEIWGDGLTLARNPGFLPYIPPTAREFFVFFSGPTGEVDARVTIARGPPVNGVAAPVEVTDGRVKVRNGTAEFHRFRYPIHNMQVDATFDEHHLNILEARGDGPTGAKLRATAQASPMTDDAKVNVVVHVTQVPIDSYLRAAMPGTRKQLLEVLFNEERYAELLATGLIRPGDELPEEDAAPPFTLGGICEIDVTVVRPLGENMEWQTLVVVRMPEAGVVPKPFPFPIVARDVEIRISDDEGMLTRGTFTGLRGGRAELAAHVQLTEAGQNVLKPKLDIAAFDIPVDDLLINAIPDDEGAHEPGAVSAKEILRRLDVRGDVDCTANIRDSGDGSEDIDYDVMVNLKEIEARPRDQGRALADGSQVVVAGATGKIRVTQDVVRVEDLEGRLVVENPRRRLATAGAVVESSGAFVVNLEAEILDSGPQPETGPLKPSPIGAIGVRVAATDLDLSAPLPSLLRVFNAEIADSLEAMRDKRTPQGKIAASVVLDRPVGAERPTVRASFSEFEGVSVAAMGGRVGFRDAMGTVTYTDRDDQDPRRRSRIAFEQFSAGLEYGGVPSGSVSLDGGFSIDLEAGEEVPVERSIADAQLVARVLDAKFESPLVLEMLGRSLNGATIEKWKALDVRGTFDAELELAGDPVVISGMVGPRAVSFNRSSRRADFPRVLGHVTFATSAAKGEAGERRVAGRVEELECESGDWRADATGDWSFATGEGLGLELLLAVEGQRLGEDLLALLPRDAAEAMKEIELKVEEGFSMPAGTLVALIPDEEAEGESASGGASVQFEGRARFAGMSAEIGLPLRDCSGEVKVSVATSPVEPTAIAIEVESPSLSLVGLEMSDARALLVSDSSGEAGNGFVVPYFTADCHGGRIWGNVKVGREEEGLGREFGVDVLASGVLFAPLLDELTGTSEEAALKQEAVSMRTEPETPHEPEPVEADRSRGQADLWVAVSGRTGDPASRVGRGAIRVANGDVLRLPVVFSLVQMSNLMLPSSDTFRYMQAEFHLRGATAKFESIAILSNSISLMGDGTLTLPEFALDMRFNSRSNRRVPLLSDMYEAVRDEIVTTRVRGTVGAPEIRSETLTTTRGILDSLFDPGRDPAGSIGGDVAARREQGRVGGAPRGAAPLPPTTLPSRPAGVDG